MKVKTYWHNKILYVFLYTTLYSVYKTGQFYDIEVYYNTEWIKVRDKELRKELIAIYDKENTGR